MTELDFAISGKSVEAIILFQNFNLTTGLLQSCVLRYKKEHNTLYAMIVIRLHRLDLCLLSF